MSLPTPNLDDRTFQNIVDDVKRQIGLRCPEWTDHNVSDPGVTLIELFAWITESMLYRLNQVPERNYIKFLELLGISLESASPAVTELCFRLSRPIADEDGEEVFEHHLRALETVAATVRTETEEAIEFVTEADLRMIRPKLAYHFSASGLEVETANVREFKETPVENLSPNDVEFDAQGVARPRNANGFTIFSTPPREGDAFYIGFDSDISGNLIEIEAVCNNAAATGMNEEYPSQMWEYWNSAESRWDRIPYSTFDTTCGFNRSGSVELLMPHNFLPSTLNDLQARWIRCRYTVSAIDLPPRGTQGLKPSPYRNSPEVFSFSVKTVGGGASASNGSVERAEYLGQSDGTPGQVFKLRYSGIMPRRPGETVVVGEQGASASQMEQWTEVSDFSESGPEDKHFVCDSYTGEVMFGPNIEQPDGSARQHGAIPPKGLAIVFSSYRHGGGIRGNIKEHQLRVLKTSIPYISEVWNPTPAVGGRDRESLERAKMRARASLRVRDRAVTAEDYEFLAQRACSGVGRARCVQPGPRHSLKRGGKGVMPGVVKVLLVPSLSPSNTVPSPVDLRVPQRLIDDVNKYLDERRLLTAVLEVGEPDYVFVSTDITLVADPKADADQVADAVRRKLELYTHPLYGGPNGDGWPFRRSLTLADVYAQVGSVNGVAFLLDARIFRSKLVNAESGQLSREERVSNSDGVVLEETELICTREHRIHIRPIWQVGLDNPEAADE